MTRGPQCDRERARAEARNAKHEKKGATGDLATRKERDAAAMRAKQEAAAAKKAAGEQ
ncbi:4F5 protein, putative [Trichomonas vaginalis G3]|uniref:4F5 protein, putative n=1 Tax=Trichomonas vaginalis (strain ATCC PRA-98 / G3) TaxID=412133 RepID=A2FD04_TRIV3|nr:hypothetical protein TVAGG3_0422830 [Trichomonas vaginalis G3]EAX97197.1 4F5 protein, putative [Trichomonas vaginalis G3]KAI5536186.1 hypothetical protein TVAGG3_0422830 [Trichomonas vaginalis G3]|eukprot:XP_001310127.1 4F5 protein [Trichomonas vaginalis G3]